MDGAIVGIEQDKVPVLLTDRVHLGLVKRTEFGFENIDATITCRDDGQFVLACFQQHIALKITVREQ
jgi:hypothetical protein